MKPIDFFFALVIFVLSSCSDSRETRMQRFLIQGNEKIRGQDYEEAEKYFLSALRIDSCFADALNNLGTVEERRKNLPSAIRYYTRALRCNDKFFLAYVNRANAYYENGQFSEALEDVANAGKIHRDSSTVMELEGLIYWKMHENEKAVNCFKKMVLKNPEELNALINLGTLYTSMKNFDSARHYLQRAESASGNDARIINATAMLFAESGDRERALEWIDRALEADPDEPYYLNNKGYILLQLNRNDEAIAYIDQSIASDPYNGWAYRNKGIYYLKKENFVDALRLLRMAEKIDPAVEGLQYWLGYALLKNDNEEEGCNYLKKALRLGEVDEKELASLCR
jgi:tetratricopeptide (TPR) repeat protein